MRCPNCGYSHSFDADDVIENLYFCTYCHMWYVIVPLAWQLPRNPDLERLRARMAEKEAELTQETKQLRTNKEATGKTRLI